MFQKVFFTVTLATIAWGRISSDSDYASWHLRNNKDLVKYHDINTAMLHIMTNGNHEKMESMKRNDLLQRISDDDIKDLVKFYLYTSSNPLHYQQLTFGDVDNITASNFNLSHPTKVVIHGYTNNVDSDVIQICKNAFIEVGGYNIIAVDWGLIAKTAFYNIAADQTTRVGEYVGEFVDFLIKFGVSAKDVHLMGHSLGAHVAGVAGAKIQELRNENVSRITGMDAALPLFTFEDTDRRLDGGDAEFVDCIHTCGGFLGFESPICQVDFYPNGGTDPQPGCLPLDLGICSHDRSFKYFAESIQPGHIFNSLKCEKVPDTTPLNCEYTDVVMGYPIQPGTTGIYYVTTQWSSPFANNITSVQV